MSAPAYQLRPNKAADRLALMEAIRRLTRLGDVRIEDYTYFGLGGPFLEDFRLLHEFWPDIQMVSFESERETFKRQEFHLPFRTLQLFEEDISSYINRYDPGELRSIFWLDYTNLQYSCFEDFEALLGTVAEYSMIKVTLRCNPDDYWMLNPPDPPKLKEARAKKFRRNFERVLPSQFVNPPREQTKLASLLQDMLQVTTQRAIPAPADIRTFVPVSSFYYSDGTGMFTLTGIVCDSGKVGEVEKAFLDWELANLRWGQPKRIALPVLSTKERLHLQGFLPSGQGAGCKLLEELGYLIEDDIPHSEEALEQYATFHRYSPYFIRGNP